MHFDYLIPIQLQSAYSKSIQNSMKSGKQSKQAEQTVNLLQQRQIQKQNHLELSTAHKSLQQQHAVLQRQKHALELELASLRSETSNLIQNQKFHIRILEERNREILAEKRELEIRFDSLRINADGITKELNDIRADKNLELQDLKNRYEVQILEYEQAYARYANAIQEFDKVAKEASDLKQLNEKERDQFRQKLATLERQKIQAIDSIKKQMLSKASEMRNKAFEIRKQQLEVITRLTYLQNDQLIRELQFQSSKTETILKKNIQLEEQLRKLKMEVEIHRSVEEQIMRRNVGAKNVILSLNKQIRSVREEHQNKIKPVDSKSNIQILDQITEELQTSQKKQTKDEEKSKIIQTSKHDDINVLTEYAKQLQKVNQEQTATIASLQQSLKNAKENVQNERKKISPEGYDCVANLLLRFLTQIAKPQKVHEGQQDNGKDIDILLLKDLHVERWSPQNVEKVVKILLEKLRPYLSTNLTKQPFLIGPALASGLRKSGLKSQPLSVIADQNILKQNLYLSKYITALRRQNSKSIDKIKSRSVHYTIDAHPFTAQNSREKVPKSRKTSVLRREGEYLEPVSKRFLKPHFIGRV